MSIIIQRVHKPTLARIKLEVTTVCDSYIINPTATVDLINLEIDSYEAAIAHLQKHIDKLETRKGRVKI